MPTHQPTAGDRVPGLEPAARRVLDAYLATFAAHLTGPRQARQAIVEEVDDGLTEATRAHRAAQPTPAHAAQAAVAEFGDPSSLAATFIPELAAGTARRTALRLIATGPLVGSLWLAAFALAGPATAYAAPPWQWPVVQAGGWPAQLLLSGAVVVVLACWLTVALTGGLTRWFHTRPELPALVATAAATGVGLLDLSLLGVLVAGALAALMPLAGALVLVAAAASLTRLVLAGHAARHLATHTTPT